MAAWRDCTVSRFLIPADSRFHLVVALVVNPHAQVMHEFGGDGGARDALG